MFVSYFNPSVPPGQAWLACMAAECVSGIHDLRCFAIFGPTVILL